MGAARTVANETSVPRRAECSRCARFTPCEVVADAGTVRPVHLVRETTYLVGEMSYPRAE